VRPRAPAFTLVEVLIAIAILVTGMTGILAVFAAAARSQVRATHSVEATAIATSIIAEARARYAQSVSLPNAKGVQFSGKPRYTYDIEYAGGLDKDNDELVMVVRVTWMEGGRDTTVAYPTILLRKLE
jgi:Tfp pilus assembly protein PilV